jgi:hypothetical protein
LHFYGSGGIELAVRPTHSGGITFTNAIPGDRKNPGLGRSIRAAQERFATDETFRNDILEKARAGTANAIDFAKQRTGTVRDAAIGRSFELRLIVRHLEINHVGKGVR